MLATCENLQAVIHCPFSTLSSSTVAKRGCFSTGRRVEWFPKALWQPTTSLARGPPEAHVIPQYLCYTHRLCVQCPNLGWVPSDWELKKARDCFKSILGFGVPEAEGKKESILVFHPGQPPLHFPRRQILLEHTKSVLQRSTKLPRPRRLSWSVPTQKHNYRYSKNINSKHLWHLKWSRVSRGMRGEFSGSPIPEFGPEIHSKFHFGHIHTLLHLAPEPYNRSFRHLSGEPGSQKNSHKNLNQLFVFCELFFLLQTDMKFAQQQRNNTAVTNKMLSPK